MNCIINEKPFIYRRIYKAISISRIDNWILTMNRVIAASGCNKKVSSCHILWLVFVRNVTADLCGLRFPEQGKQDFISQNFWLRLFAEDWLRCSEQHSTAHWSGSFFQAGPLMVLQTMPMANSIIWLHYTKYFRQSVVSMGFSAAYLIIFIAVLIIFCGAAIHKFNYDNVAEIAM